MSNGFRLFLTLFCCAIAGFCTSYSYAHLLRWNVGARGQTPFSFGYRFGIPEATAQFFIAGAFVVIAAAISWSARPTLLGRVSKLISLLAVIVWSVLLLGLFWAAMLGL